MIIQATFIGKNYLGYKTGEEYKLKIDYFGGMSISRIDGTGKCSYSSISSFLRNWSNSTIIS